MMPLTTEVTEIAKDVLRENPKISIYESLTIAVQIQRNRLLKDGLGIHDPKLEIPTNLQAIAIALGYEKRMDSSIKHAIKNLADKF